MDSLTQLALGAAVGVAAMGRRTALWKAALWGAVAGTLPDLDAFIDHGDPIRNMTFHRAESHALLYLTLVAPLLGAIAARLHGEMHQWRRWVGAMWLVLITHPLLDLMTVYGTQLALPFTDEPFGVGSIFIIDPLYTLPLLVGLAVALSSRKASRWRWNAAGLALSTAYLAWGVAAQVHVQGVAQRALEEQGVPFERLLVTPTAFNTVLWRVLAMTPGGHVEGFHSLLDSSPEIRFDAFTGSPELQESLREDWHVARLAWFSHGFFRLAEREGRVFITDLRMGQEPYYTFDFEVARRDGPDLVAVTPVQHTRRPELSTALPWLWRRLLGEPLQPPR